MRAVKYKSLLYTFLPRISSLCPKLSIPLTFTIDRLYPSPSLSNFCNCPPLSLLLLAPAKELWKPFSLRADTMNWFLNAIKPQLNPHKLRSQRTHKTFDLRCNSHMNGRWNGSLHISVWLFKNLLTSVNFGDSLMFLCDVLMTPVLIKKIHLNQPSAREYKCRGETHQRR